MTDLSRAEIRAKLALMADMVRLNHQPRPIKVLDLEVQCLARASRDGEPTSASIPYFNAFENVHDQIMFSGDLGPFTTQLAYYVAAKETRSGDWRPAYTRYLRNSEELER